MFSIPWFAYGFIVTAMASLVVFAKSINAYEKTNDTRYVYFAFVFLFIALYFLTWHMPVALGFSEQAQSFFYKISYLFLYLIFTSAAKFTARINNADWVWNFVIPTLIFLVGMVTVIANLFSSWTLETYRWGILTYQEPLISPILKLFAALFTVTTALSFSQVFWPFLNSERKILRIRARFSTAGFLIMSLAGVTYFAGSVIFQNYIILSLIGGLVIMFTGVIFSGAGIQYKKQEISEKERRIFQAPAYQEEITPQTSGFPDSNKL